MKTKTFFLTTLMFVFMLICSIGIHAQTAKSNLDQAKLMQQWLGTWEANTGKDTVEVWECRQYGKSFIGNASLVIKGTKSPYYIANISFDSKEGNFKGFNIHFNGEYHTWIAIWTTEKKLSLDAVQDFKPETVNGKAEILYETPTSMILTEFNTAGVKTLEYKFKKIK